MANQNAASFAAIADVGLALGFLYQFFIWPLFLSPLSKIPPAHPLACVTSGWILWVRYFERANTTIHEAHQKYGEVVRLSPNELSVNCIDNGVKKIYGGGFDKHTWYCLFEYFGARNMFSTTSSRPHSQRKRMVSNTYSKSFIFTTPAMPQIVMEIVHRRFLPLLYGEGFEAQKIETQELFNAAMIDFVTAYIFGIPSGTNFLKHKEERAWFSSYQKRKKHGFWRQEMPRFTNVLKSFGINLVPTWVREADLTVLSLCTQLCGRAEDRIRNNLARNEEGIIYRQFRNSLTAPISQDSNARLQGAEERGLESEMLDHLGAGHETSATTLTYLVFHLCSDVDVQNQLRKELHGLSDAIERSCSDDASTLYKELDALPILDSVLRETLRLHPAIAGAQPRVTPKTEVKLGEFYHIPGGTRVSAQAYCLHRNPEVFPHPTEWLPDRWLEKTQEEYPASLQNMHRWFWAFGSGGRMCIGQHLAIIQMKILVLAIYANFTTRLSGPVCLDAKDGYSGSLAQNPPPVIFERL